MKTKDFVLKSTKENLKSDNARFCYVFHDEETEMAVATDRYILYATEDEYVPTEGNGLRTTKGEKVTFNGKYANWTTVIPQTTRPITLRPDLQQVYDACLEEIDNAKLLGAKLIGTPRINVGEDEWFNVNFVKYILEAGTSGWEIAVFKNLARITNSKPIMKRWDGKLLLIMPIMTYVDDLLDSVLERGFEVLYE